MRTRWSRKPPAEPLCEVCLLPGGHEAADHERMLHDRVMREQMERLEAEANKPRRRLP